MKYDIINIIKNLGLILDEVTPHIVRVDNEKFEVEFDSDSVAEFILEQGIRTECDGGIRVFANGKCIGWF